MLRLPFFRNLVRFLVFAFFLILPNVIPAQENKPKIGLVLSGGGAKGMAHIPLLQALDSLNIVPDMIIGTSMGSVIGGLYAMGYSGDSLANLTASMKWDKILGGKTDLNDVSVEEKGEFDKYIIDFDLVKGKPRINPYLLNDQNLTWVFANLTFPVYDVNDFDKLAIPFRSVTADLVTGEQKILAKGSLGWAMRASMSIPGVFEPVVYENGLLVDGGILNNFPTDIAKNMGADIIIGSDVSGYGKPLEELDDLGSVMSRSIGMANHSIYPKNRELCDILIDHIPNLSYATTDFVKSKEIYEEGKVATLKNRDELTQLSEILRPYEQRPHKLPYMEKRVLFDTLAFKNISAANLALVKERANIKLNTVYSKKELIGFVKRTMGTNIFKKVNFGPILEDGKKGLLITGFEKPDHQLRASLHFDLYRGAGLIGNYSGRNVLGKASRLLLSIDIAEQPKVLTQYRKNFGNKKDWWWQTEAIGSILTQKVYIDGNAADDYREKSFVFSNQINKNINSLKSYIGIGINYKYVDIEPRVSPDISDNVLSLNKYFSTGININGRYVLNTMNKVFYATRGSSFQTILSRSLWEDINASTSILDAKGPTNRFTKVQLNFEKRLFFSNDVTGILNTSAGFIFDDTQKNNEFSVFDFGYPELYFLGGNLPIQRADSYAFQGLHEDELTVSQFMMVKLGLQFGPYNKLYVTPQFNIASVGFDDLKEFTNNAFSPKDDWQAYEGTSLLISAGATLSYKSILGPIDFNTTWTNDSNKLRFFLSVGIPFNR
ncbi:MAG: patatin-like phospholipase family protein [Maribacter sp.]|nr:patatin-like phospholipase family protein [Maribacter sp.]